MQTCKLLSKQRISKTTNSRRGNAPPFGCKPFGFLARFCNHSQCFPTVVVCVAPQEPFPIRGNHISCSHSFLFFFYQPSRHSCPLLNKFMIRPPITTLRDKRPTKSTPRASTTTIHHGFRNQFVCPNFNGNLHHVFFFLPAFFFSFFSRVKFPSANDNPNQQQTLCDPGHKGIFTSTASRPRVPLLEAIPLTGTQLHAFGVTQQRVWTKGTLFVHRRDSPALTFWRL